MTANNSLACEEEGEGEIWKKNFIWTTATTPIVSDNY